MISDDDDDDGDNGLGLGLGGKGDIIEYKCQVGDRMLKVDNKLDEFKRYLNHSSHGHGHGHGPHAEIEGYVDLDFDKATIVNHTFYIPSDAKITYEQIKVKNKSKRIRGSIPDARVVAVDEDGNGRSGRRLSRRRHLGGMDPVGDQRVLVLYVRDGAGAAPSFVKDGVAGSVEDNVFGTHGDPVFLGERVSASNDAHSFNFCAILL